MFDIAEKRLAWIPVTWKGVQSKGEEPAEQVEHSVEVQAEIVDKETLRKYFPGEDGEESEVPTTEVERFKRLVHGWRGIVNQGRALEFTDANIARLVAVPMFGQAFEIAYIKAWAGQSEIREKNSEGSSATGPAGGQGKPSKARSNRAKPKR
jgi:hypothetical protein